VQDTAVAAVTVRGSEGGHAGCAASYQAAKSNNQSILIDNKLNWFID